MDIKEISTELLVVLKDNIIAGVELAKQQFPDLCAEILRWGVTKAIFSSIVCSFILLVCLTFVFIALKKKFTKEFEWYDDMTTDAFIIVSWVIGGMGIPLSFIFLIDNLWTLCYINFAPKLYLIQYFSELIKK